MNFLCINCKFFAQGKTHSFCANPKQTIESYKEYVYYNYSCNLKQVGVHQSRVDYMNKLKNK